MSQVRLPTMDRYFFSAFFVECLAAICVIRVESPESTAGRLRGPIAVAFRVAIGGEELTYIPRLVQIKYSVLTIALDLKSEELANRTKICHPVLRMQELLDLRYPLSRLGK